MKRLKAILMLAMHTFPMGITKRANANVVDQIALCLFHNKRFLNDRSADLIKKYPKAFRFRGHHPEGDFLVRFDNGTELTKVFDAYFFTENRQDWRVDFYFLEDSSQQRGNVPLDVSNMFRDATVPNNSKLIRNSDGTLSVGDWLISPGQSNSHIESLRSGGHRYTRVSISASNSGFEEESVLAFMEFILGKGAVFTR